MADWIIHLSPDHGPIKEGFELAGMTEVLKESNKKGVYVPRYKPENGQQNNLRFKIHLRSHFQVVWLIKSERPKFLFEAMKKCLKIFSPKI